MPSDNIDFKGIGNAAVERETAAPPAVTPPVETPAVAPQTQQTTTTAPTETPNTSVLPAQTPNVQVPGQAPIVQGDPAQPQTVEVDFGNGRVEKLTPAQIRDGYLRQQDYTRKTQETAERNRQLEAAAQELAKYNQQVQLAQQLVSNPQLARQWADQQLAMQAPQLPSDPNQPLTVGQAQQLMSAVNAQIQNANQIAAQQVANAQKFGQQYVEDRMQIADFGTKINQTLDSAFQQFPVLKLNPNFEDMIRYEVAKEQPQTLEDTIQLFEHKSKEFAGKLEAHYRGQFQTQQAQVQNLAKTGIELPGGSQPPVQQQQFVKNGKLNWNALKDVTKKNYGG